MSGSANWRTASRNRNGQYIRNRAIPVQPRTTAQRAIRGFLALCSQTWKTIGTESQKAWDTWGKAHPRTDSLGQSNAPDGPQAFCGLNAVRLLLGLPITHTPPPDPDFSAFREGAIASAAGAVTISDYVRPASGQIMFFVAQPKGAGVRFFGQGLFIQATSGSESASIDLAPAIADRWGTLAAGMVLQIEQVPEVAGIKGAPQTSQVTFVAASS
jgi:hypothetical protein